MGKDEIEGFLTHLATQKKVSPSTQNQAFNAILFLYKEVLGVNVSERNIQALLLSPFQINIGYNIYIDI
ncbi:MAG: site-specific integrase [Campylobacterota bacterium]|nr:site-specific integrase [Campylobacterota bacterium]